MVNKVIKAEAMDTTAFWDVTTCSLLNGINISENYLHSFSQETFGVINYFNEMK
jgi:hypothetical protein